MEMPITPPPNDYQPASPSTPHTNSSRQNPSDHGAHSEVIRIPSGSDIQSAPNNERPVPPTQSQARHEQMQPTGQMNVSEFPRGEVIQVTSGDRNEQNQEKGGGVQGSTAGQGRPEKQPRPPNDWHYGLFSCFDDLGTCESHSISPQNRIVS